MRFLWGILEYRLSYDYKIVNRDRNKHLPDEFQMKSDTAFTMQQDNDEQQLRKIYAVITEEKMTVLLNVFKPRICSYLD